MCGGDVFNYLKTQDQRPVLRLYSIQTVDLCDSFGILKGMSVPIPLNMVPFLSLLLSCMRWLR